MFEGKELKVKKLSKNASVIQTLQNNMIRVILGLKKQNHINVQHVREKLKMMSVNQMCIYHILMETYNIMSKSSSEQIQMKWSDIKEKKYSLRSISRNDLKIPEKPRTNCTGFSYCGAKLFNILPREIRETPNLNTFKTLTKNGFGRKFLHT